MSKGSSHVAGEATCSRSKGPLAALAPQAMRLTAPRAGPQGSDDESCKRALPAYLPIILVHRERKNRQRPYLGSPHANDAGLVCSRGPCENRGKENQKQNCNWHRHRRFTLCSDASAAHPAKRLRKLRYRIPTYDCNHWFRAAMSVPERGSTINEVLEDQSLSGRDSSGMGLACGQTSSYDFGRQWRPASPKCGHCSLEYFSIDGLKTR
jgi:hypothetical protein